MTESTLTTANVNSTTFGLLRTLTVDGKVDAQPLYLSNFTIGAAAHNVVYVVTEGDSAYAFDADTGTTLWQVSLLGSGETTSDARNCDQVVPQIGVTATPVIDRTAGLMYVIASTKSSASGLYHQRLHALSLTTGADAVPAVEITATWANNNLAFDPSMHYVRASLLLDHGSLYAAFTSHCDITPYSGWIMAFSPTNLSRTGLLNIAPNGGPAGPAIWMSGGGPAADSDGNIYFLAANGVFETAMDANGFPNQGDFGNSFLKISSATAGMAVVDYFAMYNEVSESNNDTDLGSGGAMLLPDVIDANGVTRQLVVGAGKDAHLYVVDRSNMGKFNSSNNNQIWQDLNGTIGSAVFSTPTYFNNTLYYSGVSTSIKALPVTQAKVAATAQSKTGMSFGYPGSAITVSANGTTNGIVWAHLNTKDNPAQLFAFDASNLATQLYASGTSGLGISNKYISPVVADGKVFMGTQNSVHVFGLK